MKYSGIGGQAVIEGIMMKNKDQYATAVRRPDGGIEVKKDTYVSMTEKVPFCGLPFVRGVFSFADSMILGMRTLSYSASFFEDDEDSEPGKLELWMDKVFGEKVEQVLMAVVMVFSVIMAIGIFMILPLLIANACKQVIHSDTIMAILEGVIRIAIFIAYIKLISRMEDIRRTFMEPHGQGHAHTHRQNHADAHGHAARARPHAGAHRVHQGRPLRPGQRVGDRRRHHRV